MRELVARTGRGPATSAALIVGAVAVIAAGAPLGRVSVAAELAIALLATAAVAHRPYVHWRSVVSGLVVVILFIPIRRYIIPVKLPFDLEPYRVVVAVVVLVWAVALMLDSRVKARSSAFDRPIALVAFAAVASVAANIGHVASLEATVLKALTFLASFLVVYYLVVSVIRTKHVDGIVKTLVGGGAIIAVLAIVESRTGLKPFDNVDKVLPFLQKRLDSELARGGRVRAFGPAEHPIALSAVLVLLVPLALYLARTAGKRIWWFALFALTLGALATISRTGLIMLVVVSFTFLKIRPTETRRMWPLALVLLVLTHFAMPGTLGTFKEAFFPKEGLIAQQESSKGSCSSQGRIADIAPSLGEAAQKPMFGTGYGTRITAGPDTNACILDDQWLGTQLEDGLVGVVAWLWLFGRAIRRLGGEAIGDDSPRGWLLAAITASVAAFAVGMVTFDAFSFIQVTFVLFILLALGAVLLLEPKDEN